jgi:hypothetical protein
MFIGTTQAFTEQLGAMWCGFMHDSPMWPIHGQYQCRTCGRHYPVQWAGSGMSQIHNTPSPAFRSAVLPLLVILLMLVPANIHAANASLMASNDGPAMAFARYIAG